MRTLTFTQIVDDRFDTDLELSLHQRIDTIINKLHSYGARVVHDGVYKVNFDTNTQLRCQFWVTKPRSITWNDVYKLINEIKPVPYKFIDMDWNALINENAGY